MGLGLRRRVSISMEQTRSLGERAHGGQVLADQPASGFSKVLEPRGWCKEAHVTVWCVIINPEDHKRAESNSFYLHSL